MSKLTGKTGNNYLLDTNAIIAYLKADKDLLEILKQQNIMIPNIAIGELYYGAYKSEKV